MENRIKRLEEKMKRVEDILELSPAVTSFDWQDFSDRDKSILLFLHKKSREGATTPEIADALGFENIDSGRTIVYRRLKRIERISRRIRGFPIVIPERKRWYLNFDDFNFVLPREKETE